MPKKILIDACYLNSKGGIVILNKLLDTITVKTLHKYIILIDIRISKLGTL